MGRGSGESAGLGPDDDDPAVPIDDGATGRRERIPGALSLVGAARKQMLEKVRRALGNLVTHTTVHEIPLESIANDPHQSDRNLLEVEIPLEPAAGDRLFIPASIHPAGIPHAEPGGGGVNLATVVTIVSADYALSEGRTQSYAIDVAYAESLTYDIPSVHWSVRTPDLAAVNVEIADSGVHAFALERMRTAVVGSLPVDRIVAAASTRISAAEALRPVRPTVRVSLLKIYRVPMVCRSAIERRGPGANLREREKLAAASKSALENIVLIGLFRNVPVTAVSRLSVEEGAAELSIWLRPEAADAVTPPKLVSLLIGRDKNTGKMIQTVA
jgi:hypothetical protein